MGFSSTDSLSAESGNGIGKEIPLDFAEWTSRIEQFQRRIQKEFEINKYGDNQTKRELYRDIELSRMDFQDLSPVAFYLYAQSHPATPNSKSSVSLPSHESIKRVISDFDSLRSSLDIQVPRSTSSSLEMYFKLLVLFLYCAIWIPVFAFWLPLRPLHPLLRRVGLGNHFLPIDVVQKFFARGALFLSGISVKWEGLENLDFKRGTIAMFTHSSNLDPTIVASGPCAFKWISKRELFRIPFFGWLLAGYGHIPIDRNNRSSAIQSLQTAVDQIHKYDRSIAVSPEGTRSKTGRLQDFKKGPFHTALEVGLDITPMQIEGAFLLWPSHAISTTGGTVYVRILPRIPVDKTKDDTNSLAKKVRRAFLISQASEWGQERALTEHSNFALNSLFAPFTYLLMYGLYTFIRQSL